MSLSSRVVAFLAIISLTAAYRPAMDRRALLKSLPIGAAAALAAPMAASAKKDKAVAAPAQVIAPPPAYTLTQKKNKNFNSNGQSKQDFGCPPGDDYFCKGGRLRNNVINDKNTKESTEGLKEAATAIRAGAVMKK
jgi:hypothetical protein